MDWYPLARDLGAEALRWSGWSEPRRLRGKLFIATFHRVLSESERSDYPLPDLAVTPWELGLILESLARSFTCTTLADAAQRWEAGDDPQRPLLALTFDDGQLDNLTRALPVLDAHEMKATFFVVAQAAESGDGLWHDRLAFALTRAKRSAPDALRGLLSELSPGSAPDEAPVPGEVAELAKRRFRSARTREEWIERLEEAAGGAWRPRWDGMLRFDDLRALRAAGHEIGSHSHSHPLLPECSDAELETEVAGSKQRLEGEIGGVVSSFCYPNGSYDARVLQAVERAGYARAVTTDHGWNARGAEPFALRRCDLSFTHCADRAGNFSPARLAWRLSRAPARRRR